VNAQQIIDSKVIGIDDGLRQREVRQIERDAQGFFLIRQSDFLQIWDGKDFQNIDLSELESRSDLQEGEIVILQDSTTLLLPKTNHQTYYYINRYSRAIEKKAWDVPNLQNVICDRGTLYGITSDSTETQIDILEHCSGSFATMTTIAGLHDIEHLSIIKGDVIIQKDSNQIFTCKLDGKLLINQEINGQIISSDRDLSIVSSDSIVYHYTHNGYQQIHEIANTNFTYKWADSDKEGNILLAHTDGKQYFKELTLITPDLEVIDMGIVIEQTSELFDIYADDYLDKLLVGSYNNMTYFHFLHPSIQHTDKIDKLDNAFGKMISGAINDKDGNIYFVREYHGLFRHVPGADSSDQILRPDQKQFFNLNLRLNYDSTRHQLWSNGYNYNHLSTMYRYDIESNEAIKIEIDYNVNDFVQEDKDHLILVGKKMLKSDIRESLSIARMGRLNLNTLKYVEIEIVPDNCVEIKSVYVDGNYVFLGSTKSGLYK